MKEKLLIGLEAILGVIAILALLSASAFLLCNCAGTHQQSIVDRPDDDAGADAGTDSDSDTDSESESWTETETGSYSDSDSDTDTPSIDPTCDGWESPRIGGCWYVGEPASSCNETCVDHGGFDFESSRLSVDAEVCLHFWPTYTIYGYGPVEVGARSVNCADPMRGDCIALDDGEATPDPTIDHDGTWWRPLCSCVE